MHNRMSHMNDALCDKMYQSGVIAVLVIDDLKDAVPLAHALVPKQASSLRLLCSVIDDFTGTYHLCPSRLAG